MIDAAIAQLRYALTVGFGKRFSLNSLDRLINSLQETLKEFGQIDFSRDNLLAGPVLDEETRRQMQLSRFRKQAILAASNTEFYKNIFCEFGIPTTGFTFEDIARLPLTSKEALKNFPDSFVNRATKPCFRAMTTGTTGKPTSVCFSEYELRLYAALAAISYLSSGQITEKDIVQISTSARGVLGNLTLAGGCARIGAQVYLAGIIEPVKSLTMLVEKRGLPGKYSRTSVLYTYPSYLGELVTEGLRLGYGPDDFGLRNIIVGGELVTAGLKKRAMTLFGEVNFLEGYGMTEIWPLGGQTCPEGHLHFEPSQGLVEVLNPTTGLMAKPGEVGTLVVTPFRPYRETTLLLRYDTGDLVSVLPAPPTCSLKNLPATGSLLGKLALALKHDNGWLYPRTICEALEELEEVPLPARFSVWSVKGGVALEVVANRDGVDLKRKIERHLLEKGIPLISLELHTDRCQLKQAYPWRADLRESSFHSGLQFQTV